ncbi:hypothetical protein [Polyangium aurulentum]|uniref:hypothetical protein n=1 Tax=Polyangium aurulentum TaxID=2567896 RepID=UPI0010AE5314|nr:hypothetical protein [Polyangium aurulentum]
MSSLDVEEQVDMAGPGIDVGVGPFTLVEVRDARGIGGALPGHVGVEPVGDDLELGDEGVERGLGGPHQGALER